MITVQISAAQKQAILQAERDQVQKIVGAARRGTVRADRDFVFFAAFDGTNNDLGNAGNPQNTNVAQLYLQAQGGEPQQPNLTASYYPGPGTPGTLDQSAWMDKAVTSQVIAAADNAYADFADRASAWLSRHPGGRVTAVITGFSRGCASAAIFSQRLNDRGLVESGSGRSLIAPGGVKVMAGVLFDPVTTAVEQDLAYPANVENVVAIRAQDEYRQLFKAADYSAQSFITCVDMLGNHCDIGGSYDNGIAALALEAATAFLQRSGVPIADVAASRRFAGVDSIAVHSEERDGFGNKLWDVYGAFSSISILNPTRRLSSSVARAQVAATPPRAGPH